MTPIVDIETGSLNIPQLEAEHQERDKLIETLQNEKLRIHKLLEPLRAAEQAGKSTTSSRSLAQMVSLGAPQLGGMTPEQLEKLRSQIDAELARKGAN